MTILIVDDEYYVRESLSEILSPLAQEENLTIITAENGKSALEQALLSPPDLLITDIQMHQMNGLELAEQIQTMFPNCHTIFLSNYSEKEYLRGAIHLRAVEYLEKPAEPNSFINLVRKEVSEIKTHNATLHSNIENAKKLLSQLASSMLRSKTANLESIKPQCEMYQMSNLFTSAYRCLLFRTIQTLEANFSFPPPKDVQMLLPDFSEKGCMIVMLYADKAELLNDQCIVQIWNSLKHLPYITGLGVGPVANSYQNVFHTWQIAQSAFSQLFFSSKTQIIFMEQQNFHNSKKLEKEAINKVLSALSALKLSSRELDVYFSSLQNPSLTPISDIRNYFCMTADRILQYSIENLLDFHKNHTNFELYQNIWSATDLEALEEILNTWINELITQSVGDERIVRMTTTYIHKHYHNPMLSLDELCDYTGYSRSYLSTIFKSLTGTNLNAYINKVRIDNACYLLKTTDKPLKDIVVESGFSDQSYFGKIFKSLTGQTPKKFRNQCQRGLP